MIVAKLDANGIVIDAYVMDDVPDGYAACPAWVGIGMHIGTPEPVAEITPEQVITELTAAVQRHLDAAAKARGYDGILSAASYAGDSHPPFNLEGVAFRDWRGSVWATCYEIMADVQGGGRPGPSAEELIAELPEISLQ